MAYEQGMYIDQEDPYKKFKDVMKALKDPKITQEEEVPDYYDLYNDPVPLYEEEEQVGMPDYYTRENDPVPLYNPSDEEMQQYSKELYGDSPASRIKRAIGREPSSGESKAWKILEDELNYQPEGGVGLLTGMSRGGASVMSNRLLSQPKLAADYISLSQKGRELDQSKTASDWRSKYEHLVRMGQLKDFYGSKERASWQRQKALNEQEQKIKDLNKKQEWLKKEYDLNKQYKDERSAKRNLEDLHKIEKERWEARLEAAKNEESDGVKLGQFTVSVAKEFAGEMELIENGDQALGEYINYYNNGGIEELSKYSGWGSLKNRIFEASQAIKKYLRDQDTNWATANSAQKSMVITLLRQTSGVAVTPQEYSRVMGTLPNIHSDPEKFIKEWKGIMETRTRKLERLYKQARGGKTWGSEKNKQGAFALYDDFKRIRDKYIPYKRKGYDPKEEMKMIQKGLKYSTKGGNKKSEKEQFFSELEL